MIPKLTNMEWQVLLEALWVSDSDALDLWPDSDQKDIFYSLQSKLLQSSPSGCSPLVTKDKDGNIHWDREGPAEVDMMDKWAKAHERHMVFDLAYEAANRAMATLGYDMDSLSGNPDEDDGLCRIITLHSLLTELYEEELQEQGLSCVAIASPHIEKRARGLIRLLPIDAVDFWDCPLHNSRNMGETLSELLASQD